MNNSTQTQATTRAEFSIDPATLVGHVSLAVGSLERQVAFYQQAVGLKLHWQDGIQAGLGAGGPDLLRLRQESGLKRYRHVSGLYHFAVLFPNRRELARAVARLYTIRYPNYPTDHIMTKTTYLDDPEGNGIELYAESPEDGWFGMENGEYVSRRADGSLSDGREALDVEALFSLLNEDDRLDLPVPQGTRVGHVHLHVGNLEQAVGFYHGVLGFDVMGMAQAMRAAFVSAGGYHHHLGLNTWQGEGAPPAPADAAGLRYFTVELPDNAGLERVVERVRQAGLPVEQTDQGFLVHDPSQNAIVLANGSR